MFASIIDEDLTRITAAELDWSSFDGKRVLVSGANGFLPAYMVETLLHRNARGGGAPTRVVALVRSEARARARFARYAGRADLELIVQDVSDPVSLEGPVDFVVHAASQASPRQYCVDPVGTVLANTVGTYRMLGVAREKGSQGFLFFSSGDVYGATDPRKARIREDEMGPLDPTSIRSCYGESKRLGETMCVAFAHQHAVPTRIVRPFHTYGPGMRSDDGRVFADFVADVVAGRDIVMKSRGTAVRPFCYLADATIAYFMVLLRGAVGCAYNVGDEHGEISVRDLAHLLVGLFPEKKLRVVEEHQLASGYVPSPLERICPDTSRVRALGWEPTTTLAEGFQRTVRSYG